MGGSYLIVVDAHSIWPEEYHMSTTTMTKTIQVLRCLVVRYGIPEQLVSDNGPQFVSEGFGTYEAEWCLTYQVLSVSPLIQRSSKTICSTFKQTVQAGKRKVSL